MFTCNVCGLYYDNDDYGYNAENQKVCYACCAIADKKYMDDNGKIYLYLTGYLHEDIAQIKVTNWPDSLSFQVMTLHKSYAHTPQGYRYSIYHVTLLDHNGKKWYGIQRGDFTQSVYCRRYKKQR